jgi:hypothetical protein
VPARLSANVVVCSVAKHTFELLPNGFVLFARLALSLLFAIRWIIVILINNSIPSSSIAVVNAIAAAIAAPATSSLIRASAVRAASIFY